MLRLLQSLCILSITLGMGATTHGDVLSMPDDVNISVEMPGRGMTMEQVEARFGPPQERIAEVGKPPITRWVYDGFTVYYEDQYVIHAVMNKPAQ